MRSTIAGGKQATFAGGTQTITVTTNAAGRATATGTDLNYEVIENSRANCRIGSNESFRSNSTGTWSLSSNTITFNARADNFLFDARRSRELRYR